MQHFRPDLKIEYILYVYNYNNYVRRGKSCYIKHKTVNCLYMFKYNIQMYILYICMLNVV